jgi:hypothetical protein
VVVEAVTVVVVFDWAFAVVVLPGVITTETLAVVFATVVVLAVTVVATFA